MYTLETDSYAKVVQSLCENLRYLQNVVCEGRGKPVKLDCYEYAEGKLLSRKTFRSAESSKLLSEDNDLLSHYLENVPPNPLELQLLVATDLSIPLMNCLGSSHGMNPEMCEEHLINSGWQDGVYHDSQSDAWITCNMIKDYTSIKWYRPMQRLLRSEYSADRFWLLREGIKLKDVRYAAGKFTRQIFEVKPSTNILRREWTLSTSIEDISLRGASLLWEERATVWTRQYKTRRIGMTIFVTSGLILNPAF